MYKIKDWFLAELLYICWISHIVFDYVLVSHIPKLLLWFLAHQIGWVSEWVSMQFLPRDAMLARY